MSRKVYKLTVSGLVVFHPKDVTILDLLQQKDPSPVQIEVALQELEESAQDIKVTLEETSLYTNPDLLEEAKSRCTDCEHEYVKEGIYWCQNTNCDITAVTQCQVQDGEEGHIG